MFTIAFTMNPSGKTIKKYIYFKMFGSTWMVHVNVCIKCERLWLILLEVVVDFVQFFHAMLNVVLLQLSKSFFLHPWKTFVMQNQKLICIEELYFSSFLKTAGWVDISLVINSMSCHCLSWSLKHFATFQSYCHCYRLTNNLHFMFISKSSQKGKSSLTLNH